MKKYFIVLQDTFMWNKGAIICDGNGNNCQGQFTSENPIYDRIEGMREYISENIITAPENKDFFKRVYPINLLSKTIYKAKEEALDFMNKQFKEEEKSE